MSDKAQRLVNELRAARTAWHEEFGVPVNMKYARFLAAIGMLQDFAVECTAQAPTQLLEKVVRLTDGVTHNEKINSPLWLLGCEIYDDICAQYDMDAIRKLEATPQGTPE